MSFAKNLLAYASLSQHTSQTLLRVPQALPGTAGGFDPELLYVECNKCGKPVIWDEGKTTELLLAAKIDLHSIDEHCLIVSDGCTLCSPAGTEGFTLSVVRIAALTPEEMESLSAPGGTA